MALRASAGPSRVPGTSAGTSHYLSLLFDDAPAPRSAGEQDEDRSFARDLNLDQIVAAIAGDREERDLITRVLYTHLRDDAAVRYRQKVFQDLEDPVLLGAVQHFAGGMSAVRAHLRQLGEMQYRYQREGWLLAAAASYCDAVRTLAAQLTSAQVSSRALLAFRDYLASYVARLRQLRQIADGHAGKFRSGGLRTLFASLRRELDDEYFEEIADHLKQLRFRAGVLISAQLDRDNSGIRLVLRAPGEGRRRWTERLGVGPRSAYSFAIAPRDEAGAQILAELTNRGVNLVANAAAQSADHIGSYFTMLRVELGFYVSCLNLADRLTAKGVPMAVPDPAPPSPPVFSCTGLRDACLELQSQDPVVGNDVQADGKPLVIITGANSGGKSTFLRSVGVAQLMMQCGLFVTAQSYRANVTDGIYTHFIREEDASMTSGRLDDELKRMSIAGQIRPHCLMLFNESFAGTNEREGSEIGHQIVRALLDARIKVFFVTHRFSFADRFCRQSSYPALFLRAERQSDGHRNYKLTANAPPHQLRRRPLLPARRLAGRRQSLEDARHPPQAHPLSGAEAFMDNESTPPFPEKYC